LHHLLNFQINLANSLAKGIYWNWGLPP
jgi:hypothetical protein